MRRTDSLEKILMLGKIEGRRKRGWQRIRWLDGIAHLMDMSLSKFWELVVAVKPGVLQSMGSQRVGYDWVTELNWIAGLSPVMWLNQYNFSHSHYVLDWVSQHVYAMVIKHESMSKSPWELVPTQIPGLHLQIFWVSRPGVGSDSVPFKPVPRWYSSRK